MWRRNGYSMMDQARVYRDPRCRSQMLDQDVIMLQVAAANMDPDEFLINLLAKYQLIEWSGDEFDCSEDDSIRQVTTLVEEFLNLVILVFGERHTPGVGEVTNLESIRKEVVQLLCVENMCNSVLTRSISDDGCCSHREFENSLEKVMQTVAVFKRPPAGTAGKATYELKPEFYDEYDVFYYHYNKEEQSKSEQNMRKRRKDAGHPECNPPPTAPHFAREFAKILGLVESDVFLHCVALVLRRADDLKARCFSENQVHSALHLIGHCLNEEERARAAMGEAQAEVRFTEKADRFEILQLLEKLAGSQRIESHKELLEWVLKKYRRLAGKPEEAGSAGASTSAQEAANDEASADAAAEAERKAKQELAKARRAAMMEKMKKAQSKFMSENLKLFEETPSGNEKRRLESTCSMETDPWAVPVALGKKRSAPVEEERAHTCILCQAEETLEAGGEALVMAAFVQNSTVLSRRRPLAPAPSTSGEDASSLLPEDISPTSEAFPLLR